VRGRSSSRRNDSGTASLVRGASASFRLDGRPLTYELGQQAGPRRRRLGLRTPYPHFRDLVVAHPSLTAGEPAPGASAAAVDRVKLFLLVQGFFLAVSTLTGGFQFKLWSMLDSALLIQSIGLTGLVPVLEEAHYRRLAFRAAVVLYLLAVLDMGVNVLVSGVVGWRS